MANWFKKLLNDDEPSNELDNESELVLPDEDEVIVEDVEDTDDELNLEDETEDDTEDELNLNDEDEDDEDEDEEDGDDKDDVDESDDEDTESLIREMLQEDIDHRDKYLSKSAELQQKIDELKRQQGMD